MTDVPLDHFYHVYTVGQWTEPATEHAKALVDSGLGGTLRGFFLGVVGPNGDEVTELFRDHGLDPYLRSRHAEGWEHVTLDAVKRHAAVNDGYLLYAHTKSAHDQQDINLGWRKDMCFQNVMRWRECVGKLDEGFDIVGAHYIDDRPKHDGMGHRFFGGNYWWANSRHLRRLPELVYASRWCAEFWIGEADHTFHDMNPGHPAERKFVTSW